MGVAAANLVFLFGDSPQPKLRLLEDMGDTVVVGWDPVEGSGGYRMSSSSSEKRPHTWNPFFQRVQRHPPCNTIFRKGDWYQVEVLRVQDTLRYP